MKQNEEKNTLTSKRKYCIFIIRRVSVTKVCLFAKGKCKPSFVIYSYANFRSTAAPHLISLKYNSRSFTCVCADYRFTLVDDCCCCCNTERHVIRLHQLRMDAIRRISLSSDRPKIDFSLLPCELNAKK